MVLSFTPVGGKDNLPSLNKFLGIDSIERQLMRVDPNCPIVLWVEHLFLLIVYIWASHPRYP
eukprot:2328132-Rhodomonas_salina.1